MSRSVMQLLNVRKSFAGVEVLHGIDLTLGEGEVLGLVGENGAGKSTLMNIIGGVVARDSGEVFLYGGTYEPDSPSDATDHGIAFVHQELNLFTKLTVEENIFIDGFPTGALGTINRRAMRSAAKECVDRFSLQISPGTIVEELSAGIRQMVEITKAVIKNARILIFDEPTTSLSRKEKEHLFETIRGLKNKGLSVIYISHIIEDVLSLCDRTMVLRDGHVVATRDNTEISQPEIIRFMVGREMSQVFPTIDKKGTDRVLFRADNVMWQDKVRGVSFCLREGEVLGLYGLMGSGRTELAKALFGVERMDKGRIYLKEKILDEVTPRKCIGNGMAYITEDRHLEGLLLPKPVDANLILVKISEISGTLGVVDTRQEKKHNRQAIADLNIKVANPATQVANTLSGGNQQKVVFGKWVMKKPRVFLLDEPTRGVDVGAKFEIYTLIVDLAKKGSGVLFISSEMEELIGTCDRILVMKDGKISGEVLRADFDQERIIRLALNGGASQL